MALIATCAPINTLAQGFALLHVTPIMTRQFFPLSYKCGHANDMVSSMLEASYLKGEHALRGAKVYDDLSRFFGHL